MLIFGFCHEDIYLQVLKMKRVCSSFRQLASEEIIYRYCMEYYLGDAVVIFGVKLDGISDQPEQKSAAGTVAVLPQLQ